MIGILVACLVLAVLIDAENMREYECEPYKDCIHCNGTGIILLDGDDTIKCVCTTEWK